jgi:hypothetical protein
MNRAELEKRLVEDADFRGVLEALRRVRDNMEEAEDHLADTRLRFYEMVCRLVLVDKVPPAFVARQVGLSPQRINGIVKEVFPKLADTKTQEDIELGETQSVRTYEPIESPVPKTGTKGREHPVNKGADDEARTGR